MIEKQEMKLINDVAYVLKALRKAQSGYTDRAVRVDYDFRRQEANIYWPQEIKNTGNGMTRYYTWEVIDVLKDVSDKKTISYKIGLTDNMELHIQIYVP